MSSDGTPKLANIRLHPIKALDAVYVQQARIGPGGGLELDRAWALYGVDGNWINGKRDPRLHSIRATFEDEEDASAPPPLTWVTLFGTKSGKAWGETFDFPGDTSGASRWLSEFLEQPVAVRYSREGFPDDGLASGPTIISTASLQAVSDLFSDVTLDSARQRFRTTLEIDGVPAFWEDQLFGEEERSAVRFRIGEVNFEGSNPCARCPVPPRDPRTGEIIPGFQKAFSDYRRSHIPSWTPEARFDHYYRLATNTRVASSESGKILRVGDTLVLS